MNEPYQNLVHVFYQGAPEKRLVGRLLLKDRKIFFEYDANFIKSGLELSPFKLPLKSGVMVSEEKTFDGLFGVFNDSLPDGWGRLLLDRKLMKAGLNPGVLSPLDRLCFVGACGMGALVYEPERQNAALSARLDLDEIDDEIEATLAESDEYVEDLLRLGGSSAGARPKVLIRRGGDDWLIKFRSSLDPKDIGAIEYAYHLMAKQAGLVVPEANLFPSRKGLGYFGVKRFDRKDDDVRIHMHTVAGLLHADHRESALDYENILKATLHLTRDIRQCELQFRNAVFNVLSHNRDDHSKNFSFLMDSEGVWSVSPAYDLTFSFGPAGEHSTMVMGEGRKPSSAHLLKLASVVDIKADKALAILSEVQAAVQQWDVFAREAGVSKLQTKNIKQALSAVAKSR